MRLLSLFVFFAIVLCSCGKDQAVTDKELIEAYLLENNLNYSETPEGIYYKLDGNGTGDEKPTILSSVTVDYTGYFLDGDVFDTNLPGDPISFGLTQVIEGWGIGLQLFKRGETGTLIIPSQYAYGSSGRGSIPGNSVLIFDIKLYDF